jgi:hypothetical protein
MSPTVFRFRKYRFFFFSREEDRMHVHVSSPQGEAKFWIEPVIVLAYHYDLERKDLKEIQKIIEVHKDEIKKAWQRHFKS